MMGDTSFTEQEALAAANIEAAIRAIGSILHLGEMRESVVDHLKDRMRGALTPDQLRDPTAAYSAQLLTLATGFVKETYGIGKPRNIFDATPQAERTDAETKSTSFFDAKGLSRLDKMGGGSDAAYYGSGSGYAALSSSTYDPSKGIGSLTPENFGTSEFKRAGLDYSTTMRLAAAGFSQTAIIQAAALTGDLVGKENLKENVEAVARLKRDTPWIEQNLRSAKEHWDDAAGLDRMAALADARHDTDSAAKYRKMADDARTIAQVTQQGAIDRVTKDHPERLPDAVKTFNNIRKSAKPDLAAISDSPDVQADIARKFDNLSSHKDDPEARDAVAQVRKRYGDSPKARAALDRLEAQSGKMAATILALAKNANQVDAKLAAATAASDDLLADINGPPAKASPSQVVATSPAKASDSASPSAISGDAAPPNRRKPAGNTP